MVSAASISYAIPNSLSDAYHATTAKNESESGTGVTVCFFPQQPAN